MTKSLRALLSFVLLSLVATPLCHADDHESVSLFNGKNLKGWTGHLEKVDGEEIKMKDVWSVQDGLLVCKGEPMGYLRTKDKYENFKLTLQWRWAPEKEAGNSGVLLRLTGKPKSFLAKCAEAQLKSGSAGDIWGFYGFPVSGDQDRVREIKGHEVLGDFAGVAAMKNAEKAPGEWNDYEITLSGSDLTLKINGELVNQATDLATVPGFIGLQSEGAEIHFRNVELTPLK